MSTRKMQTLRQEADRVLSMHRLHADKYFRWLLGLDIASMDNSNAPFLLVLLDGQNDLLDEILPSVQAKLNMFCVDNSGRPPSRQDSPKSDAVWCCAFDGDIGASIRTAARIVEWFSSQVFNVNSCIGVGANLFNVLAVVECGVSGRTNVDGQCLALWNKLGLDTASSPVQVDYEEYFVKQESILKKRLESDEQRLSEGEDICQIVATR